MAKKFFTSIWFIWFAGYILLIIAVGIYTNNIDGALRGILLYPWSFLMGVLAYRRAAEHSVHLTGGSLRDLQASSTPQPDTGLKADSNPPASK